MRGYQKFGGVPLPTFIGSGAFALSCAAAVPVVDPVFVVPLVVETVNLLVLTRHVLADRAEPLPARAGEFARVSVSARLGSFYVVGFMLVIWGLWNGLTWVVTLGALLTVLGLWTAWPRRGTLLSADQRGLLVVHRGRHHHADWSQAHTAGPGLFTGPDWRIRVPFVASQQALTFARTIGPAIRDAQFAQLSAQADREAVTLGPVTLAEDGLTVQGTTLPWAEITGLSVGAKGFLEIRTTRGPARKVFDAHDPELVIALAERRLGGSQRLGRFIDPGYPRPTFGVPAQARPVDLAKPAESSS